MFSADSLSCFGFCQIWSRGTGVKKPFFDERYAGSDLKERTGRDDYLRGATRCFDGDECVKSHLRRVPMHPLFSIFLDFAGLQRHGDRKGTWRDYPRKGQRSVSFDNEGMLPANQKMSNIFLQSGQYIDIAHKKAVYCPLNFGSGGGLMFYSR